MHSIEKNDEQDVEWLGIEPLARNMFYAIAIIVLLMFMLTDYNNNSTAGIANQFFSGSKDSVTTSVLLQPHDLSKNDLLYTVMTK
jgi:hypothetical protein